MPSVADVQVVRGQVVDGGLDADEPEQWRGEAFAEQGEGQGHAGHHQQRLRGHVAPAHRAAGRRAFCAISTAPAVDSPLPSEISTVNSGPLAATDGDCA